LSLALQVHELETTLSSNEEGGSMLLEQRL
jgi:hypothetical protein